MNPGRLTLQIFLIFLLCLGLTANYSSTSADDGGSPNSNPSGSSTLNNINNAFSTVKNDVLNPAGEFFSVNTFDDDYSDCDSICDGQNLDGQLQAQCLAYNQYRSGFDPILIDEILMFADITGAAGCWTACFVPAAISTCMALSVGINGLEFAALIAQQKSSSSTLDKVDLALQGAGFVLGLAGGGLDLSIFGDAAMFGAF